MAKRRRAASSGGFGDRLRRIIGDRGLSGYAVATSAGVAPSVVCRFLNRERGLTLETFEAIAGSLGLRLVETGRGRGRPSKAPRRSAGARPSGPDPEEEIVADGVDWGEAGDEIKDATTPGLD